MFACVKVCFHTAGRSRVNKLGHSSLVGQISGSKTHWVFES